MVLALAAGLFDAWTTNDCIRIGKEENGILTKRIIGTKPSPLKVYLFSWATWTIFLFVSLYVFPFIGMWTIGLQAEQIIGHAWAGYHNRKLYNASKH